MGVGGLMGGTGGPTLIIPVEWPGLIALSSLRVGTRPSAATPRRPGGAEAGGAEAELFLVEAAPFFFAGPHPNPPLALRERGPRSGKEPPSHPPPGPRRGRLLLLLHEAQGPAPSAGGAEEIAAAAARHLPVCADFVTSSPPDGAQDLPTCTGARQ